MSLEQQLIQEFGTATFSDVDPQHKSLGWAPAEDKRDWQLVGQFDRERTKGLQHYANPIQLDQGREGACVGFGTTGVINAEPGVHEFGNEFGFALYRLAKMLDPWPGDYYEGTTVRAGADAAIQQGFFSGYAFTRSTQTLAHYLLNYGPATIGVDWMDGMDRVDSEGYIHATGEARGGHCVVVDGVVWDMDDEVNRFRIRNSWGKSWGFNGRARISAEDLQKLFDNGGTACCPVEVQ